MSLIKIAARVRGFFAGDYPENREDEQLIMNTRGDLAIAQSLPELTELVRLGMSFHILSAAAAALTAVPTTVSGYSLWNGEPDSGLSYAIDSFGTVEIVTDATQQNSLALFAMNNKGKIAAPTDDGTAIGSFNGSKKGSNALKAAAVTVVNDVWSPHGPSAPGGTAFAGAVWRVTEAFVRGLYLVRPAGLFSIAAAKTIATAAQIRYFIRWHEVQLKTKA